MTNEHSGNGSQFHIVVNARARTVPSEDVSFTQVVALAFDPVPTGDDVLLTVTYRNAAEHQDGSLVDGQTVKVRNGTTFNVTRTTRS